MVQSLPLIAVNTPTKRINFSVLHKAIPNQAEIVVQNSPDGGTWTTLLSETIYEWPDGEEPEKEHILEALLVKLDQAVDRWKLVPAAIKDALKGRSAAAS